MPQEVLALCWAHASRAIKQRHRSLIPPLHMPLTACTHTAFGEEADRVIPNPPYSLTSSCGPAQGWCQLHMEMGQKEAAQQLPTVSLGAPSSCRPFLKKMISKEKRMHQNHQTSPLRNSVSTCKLQPTQSPQAAFSALQGAQLTHQVRLPVTCWLASSVPCPSAHQLSSELRERSTQPSPMQTSANLSRFAGGLKSRYFSKDCKPASKMCPELEVCVSLAHPSLIHKHGLPTRHPRPSPLSRRAVIAHLSHATPTYACSQQSRFSSFSLGNFLTLWVVFFWNCKWFLWFVFLLAACAKIPVHNSLVCS